MTESGPAHEPHATHDAHSAEHGVGKYVAVFVALVFLTACSFWTYSEYWPSALNTDTVKRLFMMAVSCTKAMLVILFFMHLKWEANWKYVVTIPASFMAIFLMLALVPDVGLRVRRFSEERTAHSPTTADATAIRQASHAYGSAEHHDGAESHEGAPSHEGATEGHAEPAAEGGATEAER